MLTEKSSHFYIIAGPNGSGKTTFVRRFLPYYADCINFVNADLIAAGLSPFSPDIAAHKIEKNWIPDRACPVPDTGSGMTKKGFFDFLRSRQNWDVRRGIPWTAA